MKAPRMLILTFLKTKNLRRKLYIHETISNSQSFFLILPLAYYDYLQSCGNKVCKWLEIKVPIAFINP